ncbi:MAG: nucleoside-diphosphate kinase [Candidatus Omnitrophota bacterium]|nr:nucleoside-diphosphate kinase [Candidatus Omnitrophota bacterium]
MKQINKIINIALIFTLIGAFLTPQHGYALRPLMQGSLAKETVKVQEKKDKAFFITLSDLQSQNFTFAMFKPDAGEDIQKEILDEIKDKGFKIVYIGNPRRYTQENARRHYAEHDERHKNKPYYNPLVQYLISGESVPLILQKTDSKNAVEEFKKLAGESNGTEPGTLRYRRTQLVPSGSGINLQHNKIHASGSMAEALREISIIFTDEELEAIFDDDLYSVIKNKLSGLEEEILKNRVTIDNLLGSAPLKDEAGLLKGIVHFSPYGLTERQQVLLKEFDAEVQGIIDFFLSHIRQDLQRFFPISAVTIFEHVFGKDVVEARSWSSLAVMLSKEGRLAVPEILLYCRNAMEHLEILTNVVSVYSQEKSLLDYAVILSNSEDANRKRLAEAIKNPELRAKLASMMNDYLSHIKIQTERLKRILAALESGDADVVNVESLKAVRTAN